jgi:hypothetical protein
MAYNDSYVDWYMNAVNRGQMINDSINKERRGVDNLRSKEIVDYHTYQFHTKWLLAENLQNINWLINQFPVLRSTV